MTVALGFRLGAVPSALDCDFVQANGALVSPAPSQQSWVQIQGGGAGVVVATVSSNELIFTPNGNYPAAAYTGVELPGTAKRISASIKFGAGTSGASAVLIANANGLTTISQITQSSVHVVFTDVYVRAGFFSGGSLTYHQIIYSTPLAHDGTAYPIGWELNGNDMTVSLPDGTKTIVTDTGFAAANGRFATFEHFSNALGEGLPRFAGAFASVLGS